MLCALNYVRDEKSLFNRITNIATVFDKPQKHQDEPAKKYHYGSFGVIQRQQSKVGSHDNSTNCDSGHFNRAFGQLFACICLLV